MFIFIHVWTLYAHSLCIWKWGCMVMFSGFRRLFYSYRASISQQWEVAKERTLRSFVARLGWLVEAWLSSVTKPLFLERWACNRTHTPHPFRVIGLRVADFPRAVNQATGSRYQWKKLGKKGHCLVVWLHLLSLVDAETKLEIFHCSNLRCEFFCFLKI